MIELIAIYNLTDDRKWFTLDPDLWSEEKASQWAEEHPHLMMFFINISTEIS